MEGGGSEGDEAHSALVCRAIVSIAGHLGKDAEWVWNTLTRNQTRIYYREIQAIEHQRLHDETVAENVAFGSAIAAAFGEKRTGLQQFLDHLVPTTPHTDEPMEITEKRFAAMGIKAAPKESSGFDDWKDLDSAGT